MIHQREISKLTNRIYTEACTELGKAKAIRVPEATIERDYCLAWFLTELAISPLGEKIAFKGGTALRRVHFGDYRFSEDLDFTLLAPMPLADLLAAFDSVFATLKEKSGITFRHSADEPQTHIRNDTFYLIFKGPLPAENSVKVDVTKSETVVFPLERKRVIRTYPEYADLPENHALLVYSFPEIVVEKTLAVTDGARKEPRDLYDLWYIQEEGHLPHPEEVIAGLNKKLASREGRAGDVLVPRLEKVEKHLKAAWEKRLRSQVTDLPNFDSCYRDVKRLLAQFDQFRAP